MPWPPPRGQLLATAEGSEYSNLHESFPCQTHTHVPADVSDQSEPTIAPPRNHDPLLLWGLLSALLLGWVDHAAAAPRNVVLIVGSDHGLQLGCYGNQDVKTPHLDALASQATRFEYAFAADTSRSPSRAAILTGLASHANGQYGQQQGASNFHTRRFVRSLPVLLRDVGYRTGLFGDTYVQPDETYRFDETANQATKNGRHTVRMADNCRAFISLNDPRPFFILFAPADPHREGDGFANDEEYGGIPAVKYDPQTLSVPAWLPDCEATRKELAEYYQAISRLDTGVGSLIKSLKATGHWDDTLIIYTSDNGPPFPGGKTNLYDAGLRVPLIIRDPEQEHGRVSRSLVSLLDVAPTILDFTRMKGPSYPLHGRSLLPLLEETPQPGWDEVYASHAFHEVTQYYPMRCLRTSKYKLILNLAQPLPFPLAPDVEVSATWQSVQASEAGKLGARSVHSYRHRPRWELYDLQRDPHETVNLAEQPEHAKTLADLQARLQAWREKTEDPWLK